MTMLQHGLVPSTGGYQIERSLRFNSADSAYLSRTPASAGNLRTWTWSAWVKRSKLSSSVMLFSSESTGVNFTNIYFTPDDILSLYTITSGTDYSENTAAVLRDVSAWYHIVVAVDTTQATAANRCKIYINGVQQTTTQAYGQIPQNYDTWVNTTNQHALGRNEDGPGQYVDAYMTEVNFLDGSTPTTTTRTVGGVTETVLTQFGEFDTDTGVWKPKAYSGTYGTNGFYLKFADNSGTTSTTLGKDSSGNGNNWTPNNFYVGPGTTNAEKAGIDSLVDTPTPYGTDTGAGGEVRGNYATLNPLDNGGMTLANGNLQFDRNNTIWYSVRSTFGLTSGKWYWEVTPTASTGTLYVMVGISKNSASLSSYFGIDANGWGYYSQDGKKFNNNVDATYGNTWTTNDVIGISFDADSGELKFYKNGTVQNSGTAAYTGLTSGPYFPTVGMYGTATAYINFGQRPFAYTAPSGFKALCTQNLPTPTIGATATTRADDYFNTVLWTGNGNSSRSFTGWGFAPDFIWMKGRSGTSDHALIDIVRGTGSKVLESNMTDAENSYGLSVTSFDSDGFTGATGSINFSYANNNNDTYVGWGWKANGAGSSNTQGTITSTVSANQTAGFSIVTYTGNGTSGATVGHGCLVNGVATTPEMLIFKNRDATDGWIVFQKYVGGTDDWWDTRLLLASTAARADNAGYLTAAPTSTLLTLSNTSPVNTSSQKYLIYCFAPVAGYSAFGSYTGNGSTDGPFIFTGFRPRWIMIKRSSTAGESWFIHDTSRSPYNVSNLFLAANLNWADTTAAQFDILSNGIKIRESGSGTNSNGDTFIYACFAENPFKYSLAR